VVVAHRVDIPGVHSVATDDVRGAELAVEHLVVLGHRRIAHITGDPTPPTRDRREGYERGMRQAGLAPTVVSGTFGEDGGYAAAERLLQDGPAPTAICAPNDLAAIGVLAAVDDAGLQVPADVSVVGYDDSALAGLRQVSLTTVHQPRRALGRRAVEVLYDHLDGRSADQRVLLPPRLVVRSTTAVAP
jgi:DNA-binding LacI/PurR family transcriptional regulator